ncbi:hypothetical protein Tco_0655124 [Tanacetum coccineum]|uniref:Gag-Pol polyprotein n=1 Tax=Tanacetum coccineum TaxID=301880 RepID=A0ABQ4X642_9ASTR
MSTSSAHQQSLVDAEFETRPPMLERGSYIPWKSRFRSYLNQNRETQKFLNHSIDKGPYVFKKIQPDPNQPKRDETEDDLTGDNLKKYEANIEAMNLILIPIKNDIYNSMDSSGKSLVLVYNRFSQLMNDLTRNNIKLPNVTINTKILNCLQPEWYKYVTSVCLAKNVRDAPYDDLFDYLQQYEKLVIATRLKKAAKTYDPLTLVAYTTFSSRSSHPYYVTHPPFVVDYDDDYQGDTFQNDPEDPLTSAIMLLAHAITQHYSTPTNN